MSQRFTPEQKEHAAQCLAANNGDHQRTSQETGISERTLYRWFPASKLRYPPAPTVVLPRRPRFMSEELAEKIQEEKAQYDDTVIDDLMNRMIEQALALAERFAENIEQAPPVSQMMAFTRLVDRILKLDERRPRLTSGGRHVMEFIMPDGVVTPIHPFFGRGGIREESIQEWEAENGPAPNPYDHLPPIDDWNRVGLTARVRWLSDEEREEGENDGWRHPDDPLAWKQYTEHRQSPFLQDQQDSEAALQPRQSTASFSMWGYDDEDD